MYRRLVFEYILVNILFRTLVFAFAFSMIAVIAIILAPALQYHLPLKAKSSLLVSSFSIGFLLGLVIGLNTDRQFFLALYRAKKKAAKFLANKNTFNLNRFIQRSRDNTHQVRLTRHDAWFLEHFHCEVLDSKRAIILKNYIYGKPEKINTTIWHYINKNNAPKQILFLTTPYRSGRVNHVSVASSEKVEHLIPNLPDTQILLIQEEKSGVFLFRFSNNLMYAGDTWHQSIEEAKKQAAFEYDVSVTSWQKIPPDVKDVNLYLQENA